MKQQRLPPAAPVLLESMRAIGYDPPAAIADLVDNSISAGATDVHIYLTPSAPFSLGILDNGHGMTPDELMAAMRHGSRDPGEERAINDLGRFGLGLKTASLSQCRRLTVVSRRDGQTCGMVWDLDEVARERDWLVGVLDAADLLEIAFIQELQAMESGTLVVWEKLDRLAAGDRGDGMVLGERIVEVMEHLALVFHRFLHGREPELRIRVNGTPLTPRDPFLEEDGSIAGPEEPLTVDGHHVLLRAFTLPHISRLSRGQIDKAGGELGLRRQQGFYVYRSRRLIVWGTWFRLFRQEELTKLTRVRVDVPNALDHLWSLDIKKSAATPPPLIRDRLRGLVPSLVRSSRQANQYRGRASEARGIRPLWKRIEDRDGVRYEIDGEHPVIAGFREILDDGVVSEMENILRAIGECLPVEGIYNDRANDKMGHCPEAPPGVDIEEHLEELARQMLGAFADRPQERDRLLSALGILEPFALYPALVSRLQKRLRNG